MDEILKQMRALVDKAKAEKRDFTEDELKEYNELDEKRKAAEVQEKRDAALAQAEADARETKAQLEKVEAERKEAEERAKRATERTERHAPASTMDKPEHTEQRTRIERVRRYGSLRNFTTGEDAEERAYRFGQWCLAANGNQRSANWCAENGLELRAHTEGVNASGGFAVPEEFDNDLIDLRERFGVFRRNARVVPMMSDTKTRRRRTGGLTAYFTGEADAGTESTKSWDVVNLTAKKLMVLATYTNELNEDAVLNIGDDLAGEIAYAFSSKEDDCGFNGDGTSTYGGIQGVLSMINGVSGGAAGLKSATSGSHTDWGAITLDDMVQLVATLPEYAESNDVKWYCSKPFFAEVMQGLAYAAGGNTTENIQGRVSKTFLGYPVEVSQKLPKADGTAEIVCFFGDLRLAADFGDRRQNAIAFSEDAMVGGVSVFETDEIAIRGTTRFDINVHDVGDSSDAGPIVALQTAS